MVVVTDLGLTGRLGFFLGAWYSSASGKEWGVGSCSSQGGGQIDLNGQDPQSIILPVCCTPEETDRRKRLVSQEPKSLPK